VAALVLLAAVAGAFGIPANLALLWLHGRFSLQKAQVQAAG